MRPSLPVCTAQRESWFGSTCQVRIEKAPYSARPNSTGFITLTPTLPRPKLCHNVIAREQSDRSNPTQSPRAERGGLIEFEEITTASFRSLVTTLRAGLLLSQGAFAMTIDDDDTVSPGRGVYFLSF
jgi:hypothetical protein